MVSCDIGLFAFVAPILFVGLLIVVLWIFQMIGLVGDPIQCNLLVFKFPVTKQPVSAWLHRRKSRAADAFDIVGFKNVNCDSIEIALRNGSPCSVTGRVGLTFSCEGKPVVMHENSIQRHQVLGEVQWQSNHVASYGPGSEFIGHIANPKEQTICTHVVITSVDETVRWE